jgi:Family of unknown function (DUF5954)
MGMSEGHAGAMDPNGDAEDGALARRGTRVTAPRASVAALTDVETWKARKAYPSTLFAGGPVFGVARERPTGGWELLPHFTGLAPQDARDTLGAHFRALVGDAASRAGSGGGSGTGPRTGSDEGSDRAGHTAERSADYTAAAERLDWEALDEMTVAGERYRVVRAERFIRMGPDGPEPPRATDPERTDPAEGPLDPAAGLVIDPDGDSGLSAGILRVELLTALRKNGSVPRDVREDSRAATRSHPGGVLLPATFMAAEREGGRWRPQSTGTAPTPRDARDGLAVQLRVMVPWQKDLTDEEHELYKRAADHLDTEQCDELDVAGRHFRVIRVERLIRIGADGPEGPRPSDADPVPPAMVQERQPHEQGGSADEDDGEGDERTRKFLALFEEERQRREHLHREQL